MLDRSVERLLARNADEDWLEEPVWEPSTPLPWADVVAHPHLVDWLDLAGVSGPGRAIVAGCREGDDVAALLCRGFEVSAFDPSDEALDAARERHGALPVEWFSARLTDLPVPWLGAFDLVVAVHTLDRVPTRWRWAASQALAGLVAPGGRLVVVARARDDEEVPSPGTVSRAELLALARDGLRLVALDELTDDEPPSRSLRAVLRHPPRRRRHR